MGVGWLGTEYEEEVSIDLGVGFEVMSVDFEGVGVVSVFTIVESSVFSLESLKSVSYKSAGMKE